MPLEITREVQVNIPFTMLYETYLDRFITHRLNPEIGFDAQALDRFSRSDFRAVAERLHDHGLGITLHAPFMDLSPGSPDPKVRALTRRRLEQFMALVPLFRPKSLVCHTGYDHRRYLEMRDLWLENSLKTWSVMAGQAGSEGARLMLENVYEQGPLDMKELFEGLRDLGVGFCLDTGHQSAFSSTSLLEWVKVLDPFLGQLHLHDNPGDQDLHCALGKGGIDFLGLFRKLRTLHPSPPLITLEPHREEDLEPSLQYLERAWPW
ncbi:MAG: sugar phosphate isomerase/epimerase [Deltaproteobacteria bacterium]|nr:sugar phosphate isomerase/epimerase [Deltaproteobacteria bacterium]